MSIEEKKKEFNDHLHSLTKNSYVWAHQNIKNAKFRDEYISKAKESAENLRKQAATEMEQATTPGQKLAVIEKYAKQASELRNEFLRVTRSKVSVTAKAFSKWMKEEGKTFSSLMEHYATKVAKANGKEVKGFAALSEELQTQVYEEILAASGRTNIKVNMFSKWLGRLGKSMFVITIAIEIWHVCEAANPVMTAVKDAVSLGFGVAGAVAGQELGAAIGAAGGPLGVLIGAIVGGVAGGFLASLAGESLFDFVYKLLHPASCPGPGPPIVLGYSDIYGIPPVYTGPRGAPKVVTETPRPLYGPPSVATGLFGPPKV